MDADGLSFFVVTIMVSVLLGMLFCTINFIPEQKQVDIISKNIVGSSFYFTDNNGINYYTTSYSVYVKVNLGASNITISKSLIPMFKSYMEIIGVQ